MEEIIQVLMSTYNGEKYVKTQLDSILSQEKVKVRLLIRDDGSRDSTVSILRCYEKKHSNIRVYEGKNLGASKSFFDLIKNADDRISYFAFSDQDDVWKKEKLYQAVSQLSAFEQEAALYCGSYIVTDNNLQTLKNNIRINNSLQNKFASAMIENGCSGATAVFNRNLLQIVQRKIPQKAYMHDWWLYLMATAFGVVIYDEKAYLLYRQHENNVLGVANTVLQKVKRQICNFNKLRIYVPQQLEEFMNIYNDMLTEKQIKLINCVINRQKSPLLRLNIFFYKEIRRRNKVSNMIYKILFLFWKI